MFDTGITTFSALGEGPGIFIFRLCELPLICKLGVLLVREEATEWLGET